MTAGRKFPSLHLPSKSGIPRALKGSAVYPRGFGKAVSELMAVGKHRPHNEIDFNSYPPGDDTGALDDLLLGGKRAWWRKL